MTLENATRCVLAIAAEGAPKLVPAPCWSDGDGLWTVLPAPVAGALREAPACAMGVDGHVVRGTARVFTPDDPVGLLVHGPLVSAAMTALALRHPRELIRAPWLRPVRVVIGEAAATGAGGESPTVPPGIAPALPSLIPADIRRRLSGRRHVLVATAPPGEVRLDPAVWGAGFTLHGDLPRDPDTPAAVAVIADDTGVTLTGEFDANGSLRPLEASWWDGLRAGSASLPAPPRGAVQLPD